MFYKLLIISNNQDCWFRTCHDKVMIRQDVFPEGLAVGGGVTAPYGFHRHPSAARCDLPDVMRAGKVLRFGRGTVAVAFKFSYFCKRRQ